MLKAFWLDKTDEAILSHALNDYYNEMVVIESDPDSAVDPDYMARLRALYNRTKRGALQWEK